LKNTGSTYKNNQPLFGTWVPLVSGVDFWWGKRLRTFQRIIKWRFLLRLVPICTVVLEKIESKSLWTTTENKGCKVMTIQLYLTNWGRWNKNNKNYIS
jgi:hypothetical protein